MAHHGVERTVLERSVNPEAFGADRTVVNLEFNDQPAGKRSWWFINRADGCELCLEDSGFGVDLYLTCSLPDMIYIARGDLSLAHALDKGRLEVIGSQRMRRRLAAWLNLSPLARIPSQRAKCRDTSA